MTAGFKQDYDEIIYPEDDNGAKDRILRCSVDVHIVDGTIRRDIHLDNCFAAVLPEEVGTFAIFDSYEDAWEYYQNQHGMYYPEFWEEDAGYLILDASIRSKL